MVVRVMTAMHHWRRWGGGALPGLAIVVSGAAAMLWITADRPDAPPRETIAVVTGTAPTIPVPVRIAAAASPAPLATGRPARRARPVAVASALVHADRDGRMMGDLAVEQPPDRRGSAIEETMLSTVRARSPIADATGLAVHCTITLCELSGTSAHRDPAATRAVLRDAGLLQAMAGLGYSTGPDEESPAPDGGTAFVFYFNRVM